MNDDDARDALRRAADGIEPPAGLASDAVAAARRQRARRTAAAGAAGAVAAVVAGAAVYAAVGAAGGQDALVPAEAPIASPPLSPSGSPGQSPDPLPAPSAAPPATGRQPPSPLLGASAGPSLDAAGSASSRPTRSATAQAQPRPRTSAGPQAQDRTVEVRLIRPDGDPYSADGYAPVRRRAPAEATSPQGQLDFAMRELVRGPTQQERDSGLTSVFNERTAGLLISATLDGSAAVIDLKDFRDAIPGAGSSEGGTALYSQLMGTAFAVPEVDTVELRMDGSCEDFYAVLESECAVPSRADWSGSRLAG